MKAWGKCFLIAYPTSSSKLSALEMLDLTKTVFIYVLPPFIALSFEGKKMK